MKHGKSTQSCCSRAGHTGRNITEDITGAGGVGSFPKCLESDKLHIQCKHAAAPPCAVPGDEAELPACDKKSILNLCWWSDSSLLSLSPAALS